MNEEGRSKLKEMINDIQEELYEADNSAAQLLKICSKGLSRIQSFVYFGIDTKEDL